MKHIHRKVKGFTLIEMIIVIAIIGILTGILVPSMSAYYSKSRIKSANADAKMVYNAAQTAAQKYISIDRMLETADKSGLQNTLFISYADGRIQYSTATTSPPGFSAGVSVSSALTSTQPEEAAAAHIAEAVNRTVSGADQKCWSVYVHNYIIYGSIAADNLNTNCVGYYSTGNTFALNRSSKIYSQWIAGGDDGDPIDSLWEVGLKYN